MHQTTRASSSNKAIQFFQPDVSLTTLPPDVLPNIYDRLPPSDFFALVCVSTEIYQSVQPLLRAKASRALNDLYPNCEGKSLARLGALFRTGCPDISQDVWLALLERANDEGIDPELIDILLSSFSMDDKTLPTIPTLSKSKNNHWEYFSYEYQREIKLLSAFPRNRISAMSHIFSIGAKEMIETERRNEDRTAITRPLVERPGWKKLVGLFAQCDADAQIKLLLAVRPSIYDKVQINHAFEELVAEHIVSLTKDRFFIIHFGDYTDDLINDYLNSLADCFALAPSPGEPAYLVSLITREHPTSPLLLAWLMPWKNYLRGQCNLVFRLLAAEIRGNKAIDKDGFKPIESQALKGFINPKELARFTQKLNTRMDHGMQLENAVSLWLDENTAPGKCVVS